MAEILARSILIVEDEDSLQKVLTEKFGSKGYTVISAKNGEEGLKIALETHPDLILLDILMPIKDGVAFMDEIRNDPWGQTAKIIVLTNYSSTDILLKITAEHPSYYLIKSDTSLEQLLAKVEGLVNSQ